MDQFLSRLPKVVVKAGRVIDIRDSVQSALQVRPGNVDVRPGISTRLPNIAFAQ